VRGSLKLVLELRGAGGNGMSWQRTHWAIGVLALVAFPLAGAYMGYVAAVPQLDGVARMVFRSRFLLLLVVAVANLALASAQREGWARPGRGADFGRRQRSPAALLLF
jgi:hypothetical protein